MRRCHNCGCTDISACIYDDGVAFFTCWWVEADLCSFCPGDVYKVDTLVVAGGVL